MTSSKGKTHRSLHAGFYELLVISAYLLSFNIVKVVITISVSAYRTENMVGSVPGKYIYLFF